MSASASFALIVKYLVRVGHAFFYFKVAFEDRQRTHWKRRGGETATQLREILRVGGPLTQHPERTSLPTHGRDPPANLRTLARDLPQTLYTHMHTLPRCRGQATYALGLGKPIDSSTSRLEPHFTEPGRFWRSLRGRILLYRSSLAAMVPAG